MKRRLFNFGALISALLCLAWLFLWVQSAFVHGAWIAEYGGGNSARVDSWYGTLALARRTCTPPNPAIPSRPSYGFFLRAPGWEHWEWDRPRYEVKTFGPYRDSALRLPYWALTFLTACLPSLWFGKRLKEKRLLRHRGFEVQPAPEAAPRD